MSEGTPEHQPATSPTPPGEMVPTPEVEPSAERAGQRIESWYRRLEPRVGIYLTDPNVVLTLTDVRAHTEFFVDNASQRDVDALNALNEESMPGGIRFVPELGDDGGLMVGVHSLAGLARVTEHTKLPGIPRFDSTQGWAGYDSWVREADEGVLAAHVRGLYPDIAVQSDDLYHAVVGVMKGYPDEAIMALLKRVPQVDTLYPYADYYVGARPNFSHDRRDQEVANRVTSQWSELLKQYYTSDVHRRLESDPVFRELRDPDYSGPREP